MSFDAKNFCIDYSIQWFPPGTKNVGQGYIGITCPLGCGDTSSHGGFNIEKSRYNCHICKRTWLPKVIAILVKTDIQNAKRIIKKYSTNKTYVKKDTKHKYASKVLYPPGTGPLTDKAKQYLISRNFNPDQLVSEWGILSTGRIGLHKFSILAPIYFKGQIVSYQCRDVTGKNPVPYRGCPVEDSIYFYKYTLYGFDKAMVKKRCLVTEGFTDAWRMGPGAVATFSKNFMPQQVSLLAKNFDDIFILFDAEEEAQEMADRLHNELTIYYDKKNVEILTLQSGDPGELSNKEAKKIMKSLKL